MVIIRVRVGTFGTAAITFRHRIAQDEDDGVITSTREELGPEPA